MSNDKDWQSDNGVINNSQLDHQLNIGEGKKCSSSSSHSNDKITAKQGIL